MQIAELKEHLEVAKAAADEAWKELQAVENVAKARMQAEIKPFDEKWAKLHRVQSALETLIAHYSPAPSEKPINS